MGFELLVFLIGIIIGARLQGHINPAIDKAWAWLKAQLAKTA